MALLDENQKIQDRIDRIKDLIKEGDRNTPNDKLYEATALAQSIIYDIRGANHPLMTNLDRANQMIAGHMIGEGSATGACQSVIALHEQGALNSPRLEIAHEIEGDILDIAQKQVSAAETNTDATQTVIQRGIAAFLAGAALEDALRRLCDDNNISYNLQQTSISQLQTALYQPAKQIEIISQLETKQITAWGATRNNADHGHFNKITQADVQSMVIGVQGFIGKHLP